MHDIAITVCNRCAYYDPIDAEVEGVNWVGWGECIKPLPFWAQDMVELNQITGETKGCPTFVDASEIVEKATMRTILIQDAPEKAKSKIAKISVPKTGVPKTGVPKTGVPKTKTAYMSVPKSCTKP